MPVVVFTPNLRRHIECPSAQVSGRTLRETLLAVFDDNPKLKSYILDDQDRLRQHVVIFVDGEVVSDRIRLSDPVKEASEVYVMQALSGG